jgi:nucleoside-triphosphatase THEP1
LTEIDKPKRTRRKTGRGGYTTVTFKAGEASYLAWAKAHRASVKALIVNHVDLIETDKAQN